MAKNGKALLSKRININLTFFNFLKRTSVLPVAQNFKGPLDPQVQNFKGPNF